MPRIPQGYGDLLAVPAALGANGCQRSVKFIGAVGDTLSTNLPMLLLAYSLIKATSKLPAGAFFLGEVL